MESRRTVEDTIHIAVKQNEGYKCDIMWSDLQSCLGLLPTDRIIQFVWKEETRTMPFSCDDEEKTYYVFFVVVARKRPETDDEYFKRVKYDEDRKKELEETEKLEYLRLKAKYER